MSSALQAFCRSVRNDAELFHATTELLMCVDNLRMFPPKETQEAQLSALFPIRSFIDWIPNAPPRLAANDPWIIAFLTYYEAAVVAIGTTLPSIDRPFAVGKRANLIEKHKAVLERTQQSKISRFSSQVTDLGPSEVERIEIIRVVTSAYYYTYKVGSS